MNVSYSETKQFIACQRKWFFKNKLASWNARDATRREAFVLSKLQSLSAWRGSLVDGILSDYVIPRLQSRAAMSLDEALRLARSRFIEQRDFALRHRVREAGMRVSQHGKSFAAWHDLEYGAPPGAEALEQNWSEIEVALRNAFGMIELFDSLRQSKVIAQPRLTCQVDATTISANPDVIAFGRNRTVRIVDWKVHFFGARAAKDQLALYAGVLNRGASPYSYPFDPRAQSVDTYILTEAQLLQGQAFDYAVTDDDVDEVFDDIFSAAQLMELASEGEEVSVASAQHYPVTRWVEACGRCSFKKICREGGVSQ